MALAAMGRRSNQWSFFLGEAVELMGENECCGEKIEEAIWASRSRPNSWSKWSTKNATSTHSKKKNTTQ
jgi:hypothetical protein